MTSPFQPAINEIDIDSLIRASKSRSATMKPVKKAVSEQSGMVLMERSLMLAPLGLLAACGGSGIAASPVPTPSASNVPLNADTAAATVGVIKDAATGAETNGNIFTNDTGLPSGFAVTSVTASGGTAVSITSVAGQDVTSALGTLHIGTDGGYRFASSGAPGATAISHGLTATQAFTINGAAGAATGNETLTVTVTGANHAPADVSKTVGIQTTTVNPVALGITTPTDSDKTALGAQADTLTISSFTGPTHGTLVDAAGNTVVLANVKIADLATLQYKPTGAAQNDSFSFVVDDGFGAANSKTTETITIKINNGIDLENLGTSGVKFSVAGGAATDLLGYSIAAGSGSDGKDILLIGAPGSTGGSVYVVNGGTGAVNGALASPLTGVAGDRLGTSVAVADFNGDGKADLLIGAPGSGLTNAGLAYISYGTGGAFVIPSSLNGAGITLNGTETGTTIANPPTATAGGNLGYAVFSLGDINGDGKADYFVGAPGLNYTPPSGPSAGDNGIAIIGYGGAGTAGSSYNTGSFSTGSTLGLLASGDNKANVLFGQAAGSGDITGDTKMDLVFGSAHESFGIGATEAPRIEAGRVSVFTGSLAASLSGTVIDNSTANIKVYGAAGDKLGTSIAVGDVNGDGKADLIIGAPGHDTVYVVLGNASNTLAGGGLDLGGIGNSVASAAIFDANGHASVGGLDVIRIIGQAGSGFGSSVAYLPNFNGDTNGDFAVGTNGTTGYAYVIAGRGTAAFDKGITVGGADGNSVTLLKAIPSTAGGPNVNVVVASAGDINGDGLTDVGIGATTVSTGSAYVVYGNKVGFVTPSSATVSAQSAQGVVAHTTATVDHVIQHYAPAATTAAAPTLHVNAASADVLAVHTHVLFDPHMHVNAV